MILTVVQLDELATRRHNVDEDPKWIAIRLSERDDLVETARSALGVLRALVDAVTLVGGRAGYKVEMEQARAVLVAFTPLADVAEVEVCCRDPRAKGFFDAHVYHGGFFWTYSQASCSCGESLIYEGGAL